MPEYSDELSKLKERNDLVTQRVNLQNTFCVLIKCLIF